MTAMIQISDAIQLRVRRRVLLCAAGVVLAAATRLSPARGQEGVESPGEVESTPLVVPPQADRPAGLPPAVIPPGEFPLDFIHDRTALEGTADTAAYFGLLDYVRRVDPQALRAAAREFLEQRRRESQFRDWPIEQFPLFADMLQHPEAYRGRPVSLRGHIQLHRVFHRENEFGLDPIHEVYLYTPDSEGHPTAVLFTENPAGIPVGEDRLNGMSVDGYFLKLMTYPSRDGKLRYAPLILAREVRWREIRPARLSPAAQAAFVAGLVVVAIAAVVIVLRLRRANALARERDRKWLGDDKPPDFSGMP